jgi:tyrosyl-tRNA synthetase
VTSSAASVPAGGGVLAELEWRGLVAQSTDQAELRGALDAAPMTLYAGFDPTADSLQAGNLMPLLSLRRFQLCGHRPIVLAGGATGLIGDPSGRAEERALLTREQAAARLELIRPQLERFVDFSAGACSAVLVDNLSWTAELSTLDFLRDVGKHFPVNAMLAKESVSARLEVGLSYTEFSYMLLQAYDFLELYRRYDCRLQIGGSDQWGNITAGLDLIRRVTGGSAHGLTVPLVTTASGEKFGKSTGGGRLWLDARLTSPYAFYQYWINVEDRDVGRYLRYFTFLSREEVEALDRATAERPADRAAQRRLATELTTLVHGEAELGRARAASEALFGRGSLDELDEATLAAALAEAPHVQVRGPLPPLVELLAETGLAASRGAARRTVAEGGAYLNNHKITDADAVPDEADLLHGRWLVLRRGKRHMAGVERLG